MVENPDIAKKVSDLILEVNNRLEETVRLVRNSSSGSQSKNFDAAIGRVICMIFDLILDPLYLEHPALKPPGLE